MMYKTESCLCGKSDLYCVHSPWSWSDADVVVICQITVRTTAVHDLFAFCFFLKYKLIAELVVYTNRGSIPLE